MKKVVPGRKRPTFWKIPGFTLTVTYKCVVCKKRTDKPHLVLRDKTCVCTVKCKQKWKGI